MPTVTIDGQNPDEVIDVSDGTRRGRDLGQAFITMVDTQSNRDLVTPGVDLTIDRDGSTSMSGFITGEPTTSSGTLTARGMVRAGELKHLKADRVVYNKLTHNVVTDLVQKQSDELDRQLITTADNASNWTSQAPAAHLYTGTNTGLYRWGTDMVFLGARSGHGNTLIATYDGVTTDHVRDGIVQLETRFVIANDDDIFNCEVELRTPNGETYRWDVDLQQGFHTYQLQGEEADTDGDLTTDGTLQYRFTPRGQLVQNVGVFIDHAASVPQILRDRDNNITNGVIDETDRRITRYISDIVGVAIDNIALEDNATWLVDANDNFDYRTSGGPALTDSITAGTTPVTGVSVDRDYEDIANEVTIEYGDDKAITVRDPESVEFYGPVPREEPIETDLENEDEAQARGQGFLKENAWNDTLATFHIADESFASIQATSTIDIDWPPENLDGRFIVDQVENGRQAPGIVSITITASSG